MKDVNASETKTKQALEPGATGNIMIAKHPLSDAEEVISANDAQKFYHKLNACLKKIPWRKI